MLGLALAGACVSYARSGWSVRVTTLRPSGVQAAAGLHLRVRQYQARYAVEQDLGWLKHGRRVATRYTQYAHHCLGFLYLAGAWIWMKSKLHRI